MDARTLWLGSFCVAATLATPVGTGSSVARARVDCDSIAGSADVIAPGRVLLLGELHGTTQSPAFVSSLSCNALAAGLDLVVGLELSPSARPDLDRFLESAGTAEDRERMVSGSLWQRDYQDGRTSRAIVELVEQLRALRHAGHSVEVVLFDAPGAGGGQQRERAMARNLATSARARAESMHIILTGNLHSRVFPGSMRSSEYEPMGYLLKQALSAGRVISLDVGHAGGTA